MTPLYVQKISSLAVNPQVGSAPTINKIKLKIIKLHEIKFVASEFNRLVLYIISYLRGGEPGTFSPGREQAGRDTATPFAI